MADNAELNPGAGGITTATDEIAGVHWQRIKLTLGDDGQNDGDVSESNPVPVSGPLTDAQLRATPVPVEMPGAATQATAEALQALTDTMLYMLGAILEKMPRVTGNDQAAVSIEGGSVGLAANQTLATVTTLATLTTLNQLGGRAALSVADAQQMGGTGHIYNNITVS